jgi:hypothetical protein
MKNGKKCLALTIGLLLMANMPRADAQLNCSWNIQTNNPCGQPIDILCDPDYCCEPGTCSGSEHCIRSTSQAKYLYCTDTTYTATAPLFVYDCTTGLLVDTTTIDCSPGPCYKITGTVQCGT